jgi:hypothetical protein
MNKKTQPTLHATFSLSAEDVDRIADLRRRLRHDLLTKSEVIRLGLLLLSEKSEAAIDPLLKKLPRFQPGRPPKEKRRSR